MSSKHKIHSGELPFVASFNVREMNRQLRERLLARFGDASPGWRRKSNNPQTPAGDSTRSPSCGGRRLPSPAGVAIWLLLPLCLCASVVNSAHSALRTPHSAMEARFAALGMMETGNDDRACGPCGEITRYQMLPAVWVKHFGRRSRADETNPVTALNIARIEMAERETRFVQSYGRSPSAGEWAMLWHAPARVFKPTKDDRDYQQRFLNLLNAGSVRS